MICITIREELIPGKIRVSSFNLVYPSTDFSMQRSITVILGEIWRTEKKVGIQY